MATGIDSCNSPSMPTRRDNIGLPPGPQACGPQEPGKSDRKHNVVVGDCGAPVPVTCTPGDRLQPACYRLPTDPEGCYHDDGFVVLTVAGDCSAETGPVVNEAQSPIVGAVRVPCERDGLPNQAI